MSRSSDPEKMIHSAAFSNNSETRTDEIMNRLKLFLINDLMDPSVIWDYGFRTLLQSLFPAVEIPSVFEV